MPLVAVLRTVTPRRRRRLRWSPYLTGDRAESLGMELAGYEDGAQGQNTGPDEMQNVALLSLEADAIAVGESL